VFYMYDGAVKVRRDTADKVLELTDKSRFTYVHYVRVRVSVCTSVCLSVCVVSVVLCTHLLSPSFSHSMSCDTVTTCMYDSLKSSCMSLF